MWLFKVSGMVMVFSVCSIWGFSRSAALKKRAEKLLAFSRSAQELAELIRTEACEIRPLLERTFDGQLLKVTEKDFFLNEEYYKKEDVKLLLAFLSKLGLSDSLSEYRRISGYAEIIKQRSDQAFCECEKLCRLYKSLGCMVGIFICIFLL